MTISTIPKKLTILNDPLLKKLFLDFDNKNPLNNKINLYYILIDKSIYYRKKSKLNGAPYIMGISEEIKEYIKQIYFKDFKELYNTYLNLNSDMDNIKYNFKRWVKRDRIPFPVIRLISIAIGKTHKECMDIFKKFLLSINYITDRTGKSYFKPPLILKDILDPRRMYDIGIAMGDGGLFKYQQSVVDGTLHGYKLRYSKEFLTKLKDLKVKIWGLRPSSIRVYKGKKINRNMYRLDISNKWYVYYLNKVYNLPIGDKISQELQEPKILRWVPDKAGDKLRGYLYRGIIDTDGYISPKVPYINIYTKSVILKKQIVDYLNRNNIAISIGKEWINILSLNFKKFASLVGSSHPRKLKSLLNNLCTSPRSYYYQGIKHSKCMDEYFNLNALKKCYIYNSKIKLPLKVCGKLLTLVPFIIPQHSKVACVIRREGTNLSKNDFKRLLYKTKNFFNCTIIRNKHNGAYYIYNSLLTRFLSEFFIYKKSWKPLNKEELKSFKHAMEKIWEVEMEEKLPFEKIKREIIELRKAETDPNLGKKPEERSIGELIQYGIVNLNKNAGPTEIM